MEKYLSIPRDILEKAESLRKYMLDNHYGMIVGVTTKDCNEIAGPIYMYGHFEELSCD